ncbi:hypothetical protein V865_006279 [Kwoniella europaea PYCC6329]|uniref:Uncharacterized protein n=1 Tax=Kwoniella europaea PYCC6329 TaxID=1423913 RepID=A0AAX4KSB9_9TREE
MPFSSSSRSAPSNSRVVTLFTSQDESETSNHHSQDDGPTYTLSVTASAPWHSITLLVHPYLISGTECRNVPRYRITEPSYTIRRPVEYIDLRIVGDPRKGPLQNQSGYSETMEFGTHLATYLRHKPYVSDYIAFPTIKEGENVVDRLIDDTDSVNRSGRDLISQWVEQQYVDWSKFKTETETGTLPFKCHTEFDTNTYLDHFPKIPLDHLEGKPIDVQSYKRKTREDWEGYKFHYPKEHNPHHHWVAKKSLPSVIPSEEQEMSG